MAESDFTLDEFNLMSYSERVALCRRFADRARNEAAASQIKRRESFLRIAQEWDDLANEMERLLCWG